MPNKHLPGLNADFSKYDTVVLGSMLFAKVPFADWLPPDHVDVNVHVETTTGYRLMYYSPACNMMTSIDVGGEPTFIKAEMLTHWLKGIGYV